MLTPSDLGDRSGTGANPFAIIEQRPDEATAIISWFSMRSRSAFSLSYPSRVIGDRSLDMTT